MSESRSPKVLVVAPGTTSRGGIVSVVRLHMKMAVWRDMDCRLLPTYDEGRIASKLKAALLAYVRAPCKMLRSDIVHLHLAGQLSLLRKLPFVALSKLLGKSLIVHVHASSPESLFELTPMRAVRFVLGQADSIVALSHSWADLIGNYAPPARIAVIPNPVEVFQEAHTRAEREPIVLFVGKLEPRKGYMVLLQAAAIILGRHPQLQFWFAGHGELDRAAAEAERLGISSSVRLLGWTEADAIARLYERAAIVCLPSFNEGVPMSILEAMSHGTPVVCTRVGGLPEFVVDGENGLFAELGNAQSTAKQILRLLDHPAYASALGDAGMRTVQHRCGLSVIDGRLRHLYGRLGASRAAQPARVTQPDSAA